jgi:hypothetical protein
MNAVVARSVAARHRDTAVTELISREQDGKPIDTLVSKAGDPWPQPVSGDELTLQKFGKTGMPQLIRRNPDPLA